MTKTLFITVVGVFLGMIAVRGQETLVWAEDFSGTTLNENHWNFELGDGCPHLCGWGNNELQEYTKTNHRLEDGKLFITARKEGDRYTSTRITTRGKKEFAYGRFEIRAKLPQGKGLWPALWMLGSNIGEVGWPRCGEIDIVEYIGKEPGKVFTSLHTQASHGNTINTKKTAIANIEEGFHVYEVVWTPKSITFSVDSHVLYTFAPDDRSEEVWPFDQPFYFLINMAIGGNFGGPEVDDSVFPQEFVIDYLRVYQGSK